MEILETFIGSVLFASIFLFGNKLEGPLGFSRRRVLSAAAGVSIAYVFVHMLPELEEAGRTFVEATAHRRLPAPELRVHVSALFGFVLFYGLEHLVKWSRVTGRRNSPDYGSRDPVFLLHIGGFALYAQDESKLAANLTATLGARYDYQSVGLTTPGGQLNPNAQRRPSPVVVRVFDLKTPATFEAANFDGLFERDRETLAAELVARDEFVLNPGEGKKIERKLAPETKVLGVAVAFRELERATWRTTVALKPNAKNRINVALDGVTVIATVVP